MRHQLIRILACVLAAASTRHELAAQVVEPSEPVVARGDSITVRLVDVDLRSAVQALGRYLDRSVVIGKLPDVRVTLETPRPVPRRDATRLLRGMLESEGVDLVADSSAGVYRLVERQPASATTPQQSPPQQIDLFVIHLKHAKASDAATTVNALYGRASALGEPGARPQTLSRELQQNQIPPVGATPAEPAPGAVASGARFIGAVTIVPDPRANTLLVRASPADFALIQAAVNEIDVRPPQVLIEVVIAEINRNRQFDLGVSVSVPETRLGKAPATIKGSTSGAASAGDFAVTIMHAAGLDADATLSAAAARGEATILSRPVVLAANNEQAEINVGSQRPFVQLSRVLATDNTARDEVVEYKDVGTRLRVTPTISADDYVMLQVTQEVDAATAEEAFGAPVISTRSVDTKLLVRNGQTIVLGGLRDRQHETSASGIPFLSSIPILGALFGHVNRTTDETELYIFLTPRIIRGDADVDSLTAPLRQKMGGPPR